MCLPPKKKQDVENPPVSGLENTEMNYFTHLDWLLCFQSVFTPSADEPKTSGPILKDSVTVRQKKEANSKKKQKPEIQVKEERMWSSNFVLLMRSYKHKQERKSLQEKKCRPEPCLQESKKKLQRQSQVFEDGAEGEDSLRPPLNRTQSLRETVKYRRTNSIKRIKKGASRVWHSVKVSGNKCAFWAKFTTGSINRHADLRIF